MLSRFSFKNFRSYKNEATLDMRAVEGIKEFGNSLHDGLLPVAALFGPNGGGKSNALLAFLAMRSLVVTPIFLKGEKDSENADIIKMLKEVAFAFDDESTSQPTEYEAYINIQKREYKYALHMFQGAVVFEDLYMKEKDAEPVMLFERKPAQILLGDRLKEKAIVSEVNATVPLLSFLAVFYKFEEIHALSEWFLEFVGLSGAELDGIRYPEKEATRELFLSNLQKLGVEISGLRLDDEKNQLYTQRKIDNKVRELPVFEESNGTQKLMQLLLPLLMALDEGRLVVIDELDCQLHPLLLRQLVLLFKNPEINRNGAQLIFATHDTSIMNKDVLRRDEIWFACKDRDESSILYALSDFRDMNGNRANPNAAFDKQYFAGRYGADPHFQAIQAWEVRNE